MKAGERWAGTPEPMMLNFCTPKQEFSPFGKKALRSPCGDSPNEGMWSLQQVHATAIFWRAAVEKRVADEARFVVGRVVHAQNFHSVAVLEVQQLAHAADAPVRHAKSEERAFRPVTIEIDGNRPAR